MLGSKAKGTALIYTLCITAIVVIVATTLSWQTHGLIKENWQLTNLEQSLQDAQNDSQRLMMIVGRLLANRPRQPIALAALNHDFCTQQPQQQQSCQFDDLQGRFNINNVVKTAGKAQFARLIHLTTGKSLQQSDLLAQRLQAWISPLRSSQQQNREQTGTTVQPPHHSLIDIHQLSVIEGFDQSLIATLQPWITALPTTTTVNINTASPLVLQAMNPLMDEEKVQAFINYRQNFGLITSLQQVDLRKFQFSTINQNSISVSSNYLAISVKATHEKRPIIVTSAFNIIPNKQGGVDLRLFLQRSGR